MATLARGGYGRDHLTGAGGHDGEPGRSGKATRETAGAERRTRRGRAHRALRGRLRTRTQALLEHPSFAFGLVFGAAAGLAGITLAVYFFSRNADMRATTSAALGALVLANSWRTWLVMRNVEAAEQSNQEYLRRSGGPCVPGGPPTQVDVPALALAGSLAIHVAAIFIVGGVVTLLLREAPLTVAGVLSVGASGGAGAAIGAVIGVIRKRSR
jgi:hypothetical protein